MDEFNIKIRLRSDLYCSCIEAPEEFAELIKVLPGRLELENEDFKVIFQSKSFPAPKETSQQGGMKVDLHIPPHSKN